MIKRNNSAMATTAPATYVNAAAVNTLRAPAFSSLPYKIFISDNWATARVDALNSTGKVTIWNNTVTPTKIIPSNKNDEPPKINPKRIIYVSCNPKTLNRDLELLEEKYKVIEIAPFNMFFRTKHIECVCLLKLR